MPQVWALSTSGKLQTEVLRLLGSKRGCKGFVDGEVRVEERGVLGLLGNAR